jgi:hypothetical protein
MRLVRGPVHLARLYLEVSIVDLSDGQRSDDVTALVAQGDDGAFLQRARLLTGGKRDRQRPGGSITEGGMLDDALVVAASLETVDRRVGAAAEQCEVSGRSLRNAQRNEFVGARAQVSKFVGCHRQIDKRSAER